MTNREPNPTLLGESLKKARTEAGLTQDQLAEQIGWEKTTGKSKVSKIESGRQVPSDGDINDWAAATAAEDRLREQWKTLASEAEEARRLSYKSRLGGGQAAVQREWTDRAANTTRFRFFETFGIPRYLQVPEYTRAMLEEFGNYSTVNDLDAAVQARLASGRYLYDTSKSFAFLIDEPVLRRRRFPPAVMRPQLHALQAAIGLSNVRLGIYPSLSRPVSRLTPSHFNLFDDMGFIETALGGATQLLYDSVAELDELFEAYWRDAVEGAEARELILAAIADLPPG